MAAIYIPTRRPRPCSGTFTPRLASFPIPAHHFRNDHLLRAASNEFPGPVMLNAINTSSIASSFGNAVTSARRASATQQPSAQERQVINELKQIDSDVRQHEQAHLAAAGGIAAGGPSFQYVLGPDGRTYAVSGEVQIDVSPANTPRKRYQRQKNSSRRVGTAKSIQPGPCRSCRCNANANSGAGGARATTTRKRCRQHERTPATAAQAQRALEAYQRNEAESQVPTLHTDASTNN